MTKDLYHGALPYPSLYPIVQSAAKAGDAIVDMFGFERALIVCYSGAVTTDTVFKLEHGDDSGLSDAADVPDADLVGSEPTLTAATDDEAKIFIYTGSKRYLRISTSAGAGIAGGVVILYSPRHLPTV